MKFYGIQTVILMFFVVYAGLSLPTLQHIFKLLFNHWNNLLLIRKQRKKIKVVGNCEILHNILKSISLEIIS